MKLTQIFPPHVEKPNFLVFLVDEERYPPVYENEEIREWRSQNLTAHELLKANGLEFHWNFTGITSEAPRAAPAGPR